MRRGKRMERVSASSPGSSERGKCIRITSSNNMQKQLRSCSSVCSLKCTYNNTINTVAAASQ